MRHSRTIGDLSKMASTKVVRGGFHQVKPIFSSNRAEAKTRVLKLYKSWYRQIPFMIADYDLYLSVPEARAKLREIFMNNKHVSDVRAIDLLIVKGQQDLVETANNWKQRLHIMKYFKDTEQPRPTDFLSKFLEGHE